MKFKNSNKLSFPKRSPLNPQKPLKVSHATHIARNVVSSNQSGQPVMSWRAPGTLEVPGVWVELCLNHKRTWRFESPWYTGRNWSQEAFSGWACSEKEEQEPVYEFFIGAITKYHSHGGLKQHECIVTVGFWGQKSKTGLTRLISKCGQRCFVSRILGPRSPTFLAPETSFMEDNCSMEWVAG